MFGIAAAPKLLLGLIVARFCSSLALLVIALLVHEQFLRDSILNVAFICFLVLQIMLLALMNLASSFSWRISVELALYVTLLVMVVVDVQNPAVIGAMLLAAIAGSVAVNLPSPKEK